MAFTVGAIAGKDGGGAPIAGGLLAADTVGGGAGPWFLFHGLVDGVAGANKAQITAGNALKVDGSGVTQPISLAAAASAIAKAEDVASADADVGVPAMAIRKATPANTSGTDGDYEMLQVSAGRLWTNSLLGDGTNAFTVRAASSGPAVATDTAIVVAVRDLNGNGAAAATASAPVVLANDTGLLAVAHTAAPTAKTDGQVVPFVADKVGKLVVVPAIRDLVVSSGIVTLTTTAETTLIAGVASTFLDMTAIKLVNTSATPVRVDVRDTTAGTVLDTWYLPANDTRGQSFPVPRKQTTVNTNWTIQLSGAVTDVRVVADFVKNI